MTNIGTLLGILNNISEFLKILEVGFKIGSKRVVKQFNTQSACNT